MMGLFISVLFAKHFNFFYFNFAENINFLTADGIQFAHPLHHLGKSKKDLPLIAIDSFRHMYLFPGELRKSLLAQVFPTIWFTVMQYFTCTNFVFDYLLSTTLNVMFYFYDISNVHSLALHASTVSP